MIFLGDSERDRALSAAFDEPCAPYVVSSGGASMTLRPFSVGVFRRALTMGLESVRSGFAAIESDEIRLVEECEAWAWLLSATREAEVSWALRSSRWRVALAAYRERPLTFAQMVLVRAEVERHLRLTRAAMFAVVKRPPLSEAMEKAEDEEREMEPADILTPGRLAAISLGIYEKTGWSEDYVQERLPLCRFLQYAHGVQWTNARVWTVEPDGATVRDDADPLAGIEDIREVRGAVPIEF